MEDAIDVSKITDLTQLKALAYDQLMDKERAEYNLQLINNRILQLTGSRGVNRNAIPDLPKPTNHKK